jgi:molecular chaperone IbpA
MRTNLDFSPFFRSSIGFDRMFNLLEDTARYGTSPSWPSYDIARTGEDGYKIAIAVPGFSMSDIEITQQPNLLIVSGKGKQPGQDDILHSSIQKGDFELRFELADFVEVTSASLVDGLLTVALKRELPEAMKPRKIEIGGGQPEPQKQIESKKAA